MPNSSKKANKKRKRSPKSPGARVLRQRAEALFYDMCDELSRLKSARDYPKIFLKATPIRGAGNAYSFHGSERFDIGKMIGKGGNGAVFEGTFGQKLSIAIKVNKPKKVALKTDAEEIIMQTRIYCFTRDHLAAELLKLKDIMPGKSAKVPIPYFAVDMNDKGRVIGMERVNINFRKHLVSLSTTKAVINGLREGLKRTAVLLHFLQTHLSMMHGDMHGENVMVKTSPFDVYLIDFGMSSVRDPSDASKRIITDTRYKRMTFNPYLDLLTLCTSLREDLADAGHVVPARWLDQIIKPFWDTVKSGLMGKKVTKYGGKYTVEVAKSELSYSNEIYYAHHVLYNEAEHLHYPRCEPLMFHSLISKMTSHPPKPVFTFKTRVFDGFTAKGRPHTI